MDSTLGVEASRSFAPPSVLPVIYPARGEIALSSRVSPNVNVAGRASAFKLQISPLAGEIFGRTEGGNVKHKHRRSCSTQI